MVSCDEFVIFESTPDWICTWNHWHYYKSIRKRPYADYRISTEKLKEGYIDTLGSRMAPDSLHVFFHTKNLFTTLQTRYDGAPSYSREVRPIQLIRVGHDLEDDRISHIGTYTFNRTSSNSVVVQSFVAAWSYFLSGNLHFPQVSKNNSPLANRRAGKISKNPTPLNARSFNLIVLSSTEEPEN